MINLAMTILSAGFLLLCLAGVVAVVVVAMLYIQEEIKEFVEEVFGDE